MNIKIDKNKNNTFSTDSYHLAVFLMSQSCSLISVDKTNTRRQVFVFAESDNRVELTKQFLSHQALVEPHLLFSSQKDLKQLIYQNQP